MAVSVFLGAGLGACFRWLLGAWLNPIWPNLPLGTLFANLLGGLLIGFALGFFQLRPGIDVMWRLFLITGFLGGLTTFSTFSAEVVDHLLHGRWLWGLALAAAHLAGSLLLTASGIWLAFKIWGRA
ncbi:MAG: fluoride efflux transporter CrcB [Acidobacteria bacterium]|nr:fluoride efflux transporter CrcB [Acidobacteriota bacterium]